MKQYQVWSSGHYLGNLVVIWSYPSNWSPTEKRLFITASSAHAFDPGLRLVLPKRPSSLDRLDRKTLLKLWHENDQVFGRCSHEEMDFYVEHGFWQEQKGRLHYSMQEGKLVVEWRIDAREEW